MRKETLLYNNNVTPMGAIPISVIYGFEYPLNGSYPQIKIIGKDMNTYCGKNPDISSLLPTGSGSNIIRKKTKGCLTDIKKYWKANQVTNSRTEPQPLRFRHNISGNKKRLTKILICVYFS